MSLTVTPERVHEEHDWVRKRGTVVVPLINDVRAKLAEAFDTEVASVSPARYRQEVDAVFADGDVAVNVAALIALLRDLDVRDDYPGFVVDEILGRELAGTIAGTQPLRTLGEATFHYADVMHHIDDETAGLDDLDAGLAAGFQTRLPGWSWRAEDGPFSP